eukprot:CAMPEP_0206602952 /NCGR_PEP_ID=MMETSP0325_2-20121206/47863_1 /ASSEMBLY_ACC=CAM_ASM_000347 /TAXON_ID=2866 /ORGANISM="Crypthecodinium cohnii, Strain Seligo" /LENGTH=477 /DNA_ID=CAMNT_0054115877 /DNA_START=130 /DNA_END=1562 /DNA_ORIENTATION=-
MAISPADTGFILLCAGLVQLMTPGLAFFYGGLVRHHNSVGMMTQNFVSLALTSIIWVLFLFSLCFGEDWDPYGFIGNPFTFAFFRNVGVHEPLEEGASGGVTAKIPGLLFALYQCMFAVITPALMTGAFADRLRYKAWLPFLFLWLVVVYAPWCHMVWGGGLLAQLGVVDFAGGIVVHITAGFSCNAILLVLGRRAIQPGGECHMDTPHSLPLVFLGTAMLWFGWFGFNCGSALAANGIAVVAGWNSQIAAASAMMAWTTLDWIFKGKPGLSGKCVGCIAGLATITPAAGFVQPASALLIGVLSAPVCYLCVLLSKAIGFDDALDVWGVHGMGGALGTVLLGFLADGSECASLEKSPDYCVNPGTVVAGLPQFKVQLLAAVAVQSTPSEPPTSSSESQAAACESSFLQRTSIGWMQPSMGRSLTTTSSMPSPSLSFPIEKAQQLRAFPTAEAASTCENAGEASQVWVPCQTDSNAHV